MCKFASSPMPLGMLMPRTVVRRGMKRVAGKVFGVANINLCNALQDWGGQTCAQLHEHFVAAHMKYACNFEFAIHLNVFLITFSAAAAAATTQHQTTAKGAQIIPGNVFIVFVCLPLSLSLCVCACVRLSLPRRQRLNEPQCLGAGSTERSTHSKAKQSKTDNATCRRATRK